MMFGRSGFLQIARNAVQAIGHKRASFTLEIHPVSGQLALSDAVPLFNHWVDKTNAERMNHWLAVLAENHAVLLQGLSSPLK
jgi:hypothetical protein